MTARIYARNGTDHGVYEGETVVDALIAMHRDAGYGPDVVWRTGTDSMPGLAFADDATRDLLGDVTDWDFEEVIER